METIYQIMDFLLPFECFEMKLMKHALLAILLLTPLLSLLGTMAVNRRMAFFSDALGHSALAGVGLGMLLGVQSEMISMIVFGILWAVAISRINRTGGASADTIISVFSSTGIAVGLLILSRNGGFSKYSALLAGDVLAITPEELGYLLLALPLGVGAWALLYNRLLLTAVNPALAQSRGLRTRGIEYAFVSLVAVAVMLSIKWVGVLLINALLILPAAAARNFSRTARQHALFSVLIGLLSGVGGLIAAYYLDTGVGAAVVLCAAVCYIVSLPFRGRTR
ncbi:MAG: metal ABC transporter permease [Clostridiales bacterium]|nr:metal ABC transporter permease [Clostridiales bacterium]